MYIKFDAANSCFEFPGRYLIFEGPIGGLPLDENAYLQAQDFNIYNLPLPHNYFEGTQFVINDDREVPVPCTPSPNHGYPPESETG